MVFELWMFKPDWVLLLIEEAQNHTVHRESACIKSLRREEASHVDSYVCR